MQINNRFVIYPKFLSRNLGLFITIGSCMIVCPKKGDWGEMEQYRCNPQNQLLHRNRQCAPTTFRLKAEYH